MIPINTRHEIKKSIRKSKIEGKLKTCWFGGVSLKISSRVFWSSEFYELLKVMDFKFRLCCVFGVDSVKLVIFSAWRKHESKCWFSRKKPPWFPWNKLSMSLTDWLHHNRRKCQRFFSLRIKNKKRREGWRRKALAKIFMFLLALLFVHGKLGRLLWFPIVFLDSSYW